MELILPTKLNALEPTVLETKVLVVIGANGAGKSSFGRDLQERYAENAKKISGMHSLFLCSNEGDSTVRRQRTGPYAVNDSRTYLHAPAIGL